MYTDYDKLMNLRVYGNVIETMKVTTRQACILEPKRFTKSYF